jgi:hypothetical protein
MDASLFKEGQFVLVKMGWQIYKELGNQYPTYLGRVVKRHRRTIIMSYEEKVAVFIPLIGTTYLIPTGNLTLLSEEEDPEYFL